MILTVLVKLNSKGFMTLRSIDYRIILKALFLVSNFNLIDYIQTKNKHSIVDNIIYTICAMISSHNKKNIITRFF